MLIAGISVIVRKHFIPASKFLKKKKKKGNFLCQVFKCHCLSQKLSI